MKNKQISQRRFGSAHLVAGSALLALVGQSASAATDLFWNNTAPLQWDNGATTWDALADLSSPNQAWVNGSNANFQTLAGGVVTIIGAPTAPGPIVDALSASSVGASAWTINGGTVQLTGAGAVSAGTADTLTVNSNINGALAGQNLNFTAGGGAVTVNGAIGSNIANVVSNAPSLTLAGSNSFTGSLLVQSGTTTLLGGNAVPNSANLTLSGSATVTVGAAETVGNLSGSAGTTLNLGGLLTVNQSANGSFDGVITGPGGLTKNGVGALGLNGNNTYSGVTTVNDGALLISTATALGATGAGNGTVVNSGGTVALSGGFSTAEDFVITGAGDTDGGFGGALHNTSGTNTITGSITMTGNPATIHAAGGTLNINGGVTSSVLVGNDRLTFSTAGGTTIDVNSVIGLGVEQVIKTGSGTLDLTGQDNNYFIAGLFPGIDTVIQDGQILVDNNNNLGNGVGVNGGVEFNGAVGALPTLHVVNNNIDFDAVDRHFTVTGPLGQVDVDAGLTAEIGNPELHFGAPTNILRKIGAGTLNIDASSSGVGNTAVINGTLDGDLGVLNVLGAGFSGVSPVAAPGCIPAPGTTTLVLAGLGDNDTPDNGTINLGIAGAEFDNVVIDTVNSTSFFGNVNTTGDLYIRDSASALTLGGTNGIAGNIHISGTQLIVTSNGALGGNINSHDSQATFICGQNNTSAESLASPGRLSLSGGVSLNERITIVNNGRLDNLNGNNTINTEVRVRFDGSLPFQGVPSTSDDAQIGATAGTLTLGAGIFSNPGQSININGLNTDAGTVIVAGEIQSTVADVSLGNSANTTNTVQLLANNSYSGQTILNGGNLIVGNNGALSSSQVLVNADTSLNSNGNVSLVNNIQLNETLTIGSQNTNLTLSGTISGTGGAGVFFTEGIVKVGTGTLTLGGNNTYSGATMVDDGTLVVSGSLNSSVVQVRNAGAVLNTTGADKLNDGTFLFVASGAGANLGGNETVQQLNIFGTLTTIGNLTTNDLDGGGTVNVGNNTLTAQDGNFFGNLVGAGGNLVKNGGGLLTISGDNSGLTGMTTVNNGTLAAANLGSATVQVNTGGTLTATGTFAATNINVANGGTLNANTLVAAAATVNTSGTVNVNSGPNTIANLNVNAASGVVNLVGGNLTTGGLNGAGTVNLNANTLTAGNGNFGGAINGTGGLVKDTAGVLTLSGTNAYTGATDVNAGTLALQSALSSTTVNVAAGATLSTSANEQLADATVLGANGTVNLGGSETITTLNGAGVVNLGAGSLTLADGNFSGAINGTGGLNKTSGGALTLSGANGYTGATNLNGGTTTLSGTLASSAVNVGLGATLTTTAAERLANSSALSNNGTVNLGGDETVGSYASTGTLNGPGALTAATYALNNGSIVNANLGTGIITTNGTVTIANTTTNASAITVQTGTLNASGTYAATNILVNAGATLESNGILAANATLAVSGTANVNTATTVGALDVNAASGVVNLVGGNLNTGGLNGAGTINLGANTLTAGNGNYGGTINGTGGLTKNTAGILTLSGTNAFSGATNVNAGTLALQSALSSTAVNVAAGATLSTSANEQLADATVLAANGSVNLGGNETIATLNGAGAVNLGASTLTINDGNFGGSINGTGGLTKNSGNALTLSGINSYTGTTNLNGGTTTLSGTLASSAVNVGLGATLTTTAAERLANSSALSNDGTVNLGGDETVGTYASTGTLNGPGMLTASTYNLNNGSVVNANLGTGVIFANGNVTIQGANTNAGSVFIQTGTTNASGTFAASDITVATGATLNTNALLAVNATLAVSGTANVLTATTVGSLAVNAASGVVNLVGGNLTTTNLNGGGTINLNANTLIASQGFYEGSITGTGGVTKNGAGVLTLAGSNSFTGPANVNAGTLVAQSALNTATVNVAAGATYRNMGGLIDPNVVINNNGTVTLFGNEQASTYNSTGLLNGFGTLTATTYNLNNGSVVGEMAAFGQVALGTGTINSNGTVALYGHSAANDVNVQSGTLSVAGNLGSPNATVDISAGATLAMLLNPSLGLNGDIVDSATVTNAGTLTLSDDELIAAYVSTGLLNGTGTLTAATYALNNGTVVAAGANLGTGIVTSNGTVTLFGNSAANTVNVQSGVMTINAGLGSPGAAIDIDPGATLVDNGNIVDDASVNNDGTMTMAVSDLIGSYTSTGLLNGGGTLTAATYALNNGSNVLANLGTGAVTTNGAVNISGNSAANSVLVQTGTLTISGLLGSSGASININSGATLVDNGNIVDNAALTNAGTMTLGGNELIGTYTSNGGLLNGLGTLTATTYNLNHGSTVALGANLGSGTLNSNGSVLLNGNSAANVVNVQSGTLTQNGSLGVAGSQITVSGGANLVSNGALTYGLLQGEGRVTKALLNNTTTVNPGIGAGDTGILTIAGAYTESGVLGINLGGTTPGTTHDQLAVTGQVNLTAAGTLRLIQVGAYEMDRGDQAKVINSPLPIIGTIGNFDISDFTRLMLFDNETGIVYGVGVNQGQDLGDLSGLTACQSSIGTALHNGAVIPGNFIDADTPLGALYLAVLDASSAGSALNSLSPEAYVGLVDYGLNVTRNYTNAAINSSPATVSGNTAVFVGFSHYNGGSDSSACGNDYDLNSNGGFVGVRHRLNECWTIGGFLGADDGSVESNYLNANSSGYFAGAFGSYIANYEHAIQLTGGVTYGSYDFDGSRSTLAGLNSFNGGDTDVLDIHLGVQGNVYKDDKLRLTPTFGLHYLKAETDSINELGSIAALSIGGMDEDAFIAEIGLNAEYKVIEQFSLVGRVSYSHNFSGAERGISANFINGGTVFGGAAPGMGEDIISLGIGGIYNITDNISVGLHYRADIADDADVASSVNLGGSFSF